MSRHDQQLTVFIVLCALVTLLGFGASRWRRAKLDHLDEWGLAGRRFGTVITWFLLGGDLYTAYTFIAVPGLVKCSDAAPIVGMADEPTDSAIGECCGESLASPKSRIFATPRLLTKIFAGLMSRWMMPFECAASSASAI